MKKISLNTTIFLIVDINGNILYTSEDTQFISFINKNIWNIIKNKNFLDGYKIKIERMWR